MEMITAEGLSTTKQKLGTMLIAAASEGTTSNVLRLKRTIEERSTKPNELIGAGLKVEPHFRHGPETEVRIDTRIWTTESSSSGVVIENIDTLACLTTPLKLAEFLRNSSEEAHAEGQMQRVVLCVEMQAKWYHKHMAGHPAASEILTPAIERYAPATAARLRRAEAVARRTFNREQVLGRYLRNENWSLDSEPGPSSRLYGSEKATRRQFEKLLQEGDCLNAAMLMEMAPAAWELGLENDSRNSKRGLLPVRVSKGADTIGKIWLQWSNDAEETDEPVLDIEQAAPLMKPIELYRTLASETRKLTTQRASEWGEYEEPDQEQDERWRNDAQRRQALLALQARWMPMPKVTNNGQLTPNGDDAPGMDTIAELPEEAAAHEKAREAARRLANAEAVGGRYLRAVRPPSALVGA